MSEGPAAEESSELHGIDLLERGLRGSLVVRESSLELFELLEHRISTLAEQASAQRGSFHIALSGGGTPKPFYESWARSPYFPWEATHIWLVDERQVPYEDERSNWRMIRGSLCDRAPVPPEHLHPMPVDGVDAGKRYSAEIARALATESDSVPRFDFVLLGMGSDAHTASLFPDSPALDVVDAWASTNEGERVVPPPRVTLTYPAINAAREVAVLALGESKAETLARVAKAVLSGAPDSRDLPISGVDPSSGGGRLTWYLDHAAVG